jgi:hypothetical protein
MAEIPDIFVSYAHADNEPLFRAEQGWVTSLVNNLERLLRIKGFRDLNIWIDHQLTGNVELTPTLLRLVDSSAIMLMILSEAYLASGWCRREFTTFVKNRGTASGRVFAVYADNVQREKLPEDLRDLMGYKFWTPETHGDPERRLGIPESRQSELDYCNIVLRMASDLAKQIERHRSNRQSVVPAPVVSPAPATETRTSTGSAGGATTNSPTIFLAEVTDDLDERWWEVKEYLEQQRVAVVPSHSLSYPRDPREFQHALASDLTRCRLFVQLLSEQAGRKAPGTQQSYPGLQSQLATAAHLPILQWRRRELDPTTVTDTAHQQLLTGTTVQACSITEFKEAIVKQLQPKPAPPVQSNGGQVVFVNANLQEARDRAFAEQVQHWLEQRNVMVLPPPTESDPAARRASLESYFSICDGMVLIYGESPPTWVLGQLTEGYKMLTRVIREQALPGLAVCEAPPSDNKVAIALRLPRITLNRLDCRHGLNEQVLDDFLAQLNREQP